MKILDVTLCNYGSFFGTHTFNVGDRGLVFVAGDNQDEPRMSSNGAGKSTIFDSIDWCLWGAVPKADHADSVINDEAKKECSVVVTLVDDDGKAIRIHRSRKPNALKVWFDGKELTTLDTVKTEEEIVRLLGLDRQIFHAAVYRAQGDEFDFANATDTERKELLTRIIPELQNVDMFQERAKALVTEALAELHTLTHKRAKLEVELETLNGRNWGEMEAAWQEQQTKRLTEAREVFDQKTLQRTQLASQLQGEEEVKASLAAFEQVKLEPSRFAKQAYEQAQQLYNTANTNMHVLRNNIDQISKKREGFVRFKVGTCSQCGQPVTQDHLAMEIQKIDQELAPLKTQLFELSSTLGLRYQELQNHQEQAKAEQAQNTKVATQHAADMAKAKAALQQYQQLRFQLYQLERDLLRQEGLIQAITAEVWPGAAQKAQDEARKVQIQQELLGLGELAKTAEVRREGFEFWVQALSNKGLKSFILDSRLKDLTEAANTWVRILTGGTHWVRFETQTLNRSGKLSEKFNVRVFKYNPDGSIADRNYRSFSGGEKKRIALGIDWGLSCLVASRAMKRWSFYAMDESFRQHIDSGGREAIFELLTQIQKDRTSVFVIDHDKEMAAHFEKHVMVRIKNMRSEIIDPEASKWVIAA